MAAKTAAPQPDVIEIPTVELVAEEPQPEVTPEQTPIPGAYRLEWWPAAVRWPGIAQPIQPAKVFATTQGLYVYTRVPGDPSTGLEPAYFSPVAYDKTPPPATGYAARQAGIIIETAAGRVIVQPLGGCGCAHRELKSWRPTWANRNEAWS